MEEIDKRLDLSEDEVEESTSLHLPLGVPLISEDAEMCQLVQHDYVTGYSNDYTIPTYAAFTITHVRISKYLF